MLSAIDTEPPCSEAPKDEIRAPLPEPAVVRSAPLQPLRIQPSDLAAIPSATWDRLAAANPWATPFSSWAFHRAWWDAYGENAHEQTLVAVPADGSPDADPVAIIPLMHRHEVEPGTPRATRPSATSTART